MPRKTDVKPPAAAKAASTKGKSSQAAGNAAGKLSGQLMLNVNPILTSGIAVKVDHASTVSVPEDGDMPYCCLNAALMVNSETYRPQPFQYVTTSRYYYLMAMQLLELHDGREVLYLYSQDYDSVGTKQQKGKYLVVMHPPLKFRANTYKTEVDAHYWGMQEIENIKSISASPAYAVPDLEAFLKSYQPFKEFGMFKNTNELLDVAELSVLDRLEKCKTAGEARIEAYVKTHLKQASIKDKIIKTRTKILLNNYNRLKQEASFLSKTFFDRFKEVDTHEAAVAATKPARETPPRQAKSAALQSRKDAPGDPAVEDKPVEEERRKDGAIAPQPQRPAQAAAPQPQRAAPEAAQQPPAKKSASRTQLFGAAPASVPAEKPKSRAEIMQAMYARKPAGVGKQSAPPVAASMRATAPAPAPAPRPAPRPASAPAPTDPAFTQTQPSSPVSAASLAPSAAEMKKKRAPRGAPDATLPPAAGKRKRTQATTNLEDVENVEVVADDKPMRNQNKRGMKYETTKKLGERLRELMADKEGDNAAAIQETLGKIMGIKKKDKKKKAKQSGATSSAADEDDEDDEEEMVLAAEVEKLAAEHAEEIERVKSECQDALAAMEADCKSKIETAQVEEGRTADNAEQQLNELRVEHAAELARLHGKVELLEQQLMKAENDKMVAFVNGFNASEKSKTRSGGTHH